jgi:hypothetical protein
MQDFEAEAARAVDVLRALDVRVVQGTIGWVGGIGGGHPRPSIMSASINEVGPEREWHVLQGSNVFTFPAGQEKEAQALAKALKEGLDKVFKAQKRAVAKRLGDMLA